MAVIRFAVLLLAASLLLSACLPGSKAPHLVDLYTLDYAPAVPAGTPLEQVVKVERFSVAQSYNTNAMVYRPEGYKVGVYNYHKWRTNPGDMVTDFLVRDFRTSGLFHAVFSYRQPELARFVVEGGVEEFVEARSADGWKAVLRLQITLLDLSQADMTTRVVYQRRYEVAAPMADKAPEAFAKGMSAAMAKASEQIIRDVDDGVQGRVR